MTHVSNVHNSQNTHFCSFHRVIFCDSSTMRTAYKRCYTVSLSIQPDQRAEISACNSTNKKQMKSQLHLYTADINIYI